MSIESTKARLTSTADTDAMQETIDFFREELEAVRRMMAYDERGWTPLGLAGRENVGVSLKQAREQSLKIRELAVGSPLIKRGLELRYSYIWSKGVIIPGIDDDPGTRDSAADKKPAAKPKRGRPTDATRNARAVETFWRNPYSQSAFASAEAQQQMDFAAGTDGAVFILGDEKTKETRTIPLSDITAFLVNPDFPDEVWAYRRAWKPSPTATEDMVRWYYVDSYTGDRADSIVADDSTDPVDKDKTLIVQWVNRQVGWPLGVPDALPAVPWARMYVELMQSGREMTDALSKLVAKVKTVSKASSGNIGVKFGSGGAGQAATYGEGQDIDIFQAAGKTYDFNGIRPVAAQVATALEVSIVHLLSDPGAAGSSYGSAANLDTPTKRAMVARQNVWASFLERIILWGTGQKLNVSFPSLDDPDPYRELQARVLGWGTGLVYPEEMRPELLKVLGIQSRNEEPPPGVMLPNNADAQADLADRTAPPAPVQAASPDQGKSNDTGGQSTAAKSDQRKGATEALLSQMHDDRFLETLRDLVERMEKAAS